MKSLIKKFFDNEILSYLFFGVATTIVSVASRMICYELTSNEILATVIGDVLGILFAFATNDTIVFKQKRKGWPSFPQIIGQFVNHNIKMVNTIETLIAQVLIIVLNYVFSKLFVFEKKN